MSEATNKTKFALRIDEELLENARLISQSKKADCRSLTEYICKAVEFYNGYITASWSRYYLSETTLQEIKNQIREAKESIEKSITDSGEQLDKTLFKTAVELAINEIITAYTNDLSSELVSQIREDAWSAVKDMRDQFAFEDACGYEGI